METFQVGVTEIMALTVHRLPIVHHKRTVQPDPNPIIGKHIEAVVARSEIDLTRPDYGEAVARHPVSGRPFAPVKVYLGIIANKLRPAAQFGV